LALRRLQETDSPRNAVEESLQIMVKAALDGAESVERLQTFARPDQTRPAEPVDLVQPQTSSSVVSYAK
jgi:hypothetical protein